jgi:hypothetical protein
MTYHERVRFVGTCGEAYSSHHALGASAPRGRFGRETDEQVDVGYDAQEGVELYEYPRGLHQKCVDAEVC